MATKILGPTGSRRRRRFLVVPVLYTYIYGFTNRLKARWQKRAAVERESSIIYTDVRPTTRNPSDPAVMTRVPGPTEGK